MRRTTFENPLIPHTRMRALYRALVETRVLGERLPHHCAVPIRLEACCASAALNLREGDYALDPWGGALLAHVRRIAARSGISAPTQASVKRLLAHAVSPFPGTGIERLLCAAGAAMALKAAGRGDVVVAHAGHTELTAAQWRQVLTLAAAQELPLLLLATPAARRRRNNAPAQTVDLERIASRLPAPKGYAPLPVIPVDAGDAVALYRVVQESLVRARAGGGSVVIHCIDLGVDPIVLLGAQLDEKRVASRAFIAGVEPALRTLLSRSGA